MLTVTCKRNDYKQTKIFDMLLLFICARSSLRKTDIKVWKGLTRLWRLNMDSTRGMLFIHRWKPLKESIHEYKLTNAIVWPFVMYGNRGPHSCVSIISTQREYHHRYQQQSLYPIPLS